MIIRNGSAFSLKIEFCVPVSRLFGFAHWMYILRLFTCIPIHKQQCNSRLREVLIVLCHIQGCVCVCVSARSYKARSLPAKWMGAPATERNYNQHRI